MLDADTMGERRYASRAAERAGNAVAADRGGDAAAPRIEAAPDAARH